MNWKRYWIAAVAVLVVAKGLVAALFFGIIFNSVYDQALPCARPEGSEVHAAGLICMIAWSLALTFIYTKGHQNKGWTEGIRFGLVVWIFYFVPMLTGFYGYYAMPFNWLIAGLVSGLAESLTAGLLVALIYNSKMTEQGELSSAG
ncbi:MAG TPA: hypothetical protein VEX43_03245 [Chthoniobacterales bacterium]|nr:hypothetical protein [Chthoniobacterales bacterium]